MRFIGWFTALAVLAVAVIAGVVGYNIGIGTQIAASGTTVAPGVYPMMGWGWGFGFGFFHIFGFFLFLILLVIIFGAIRRAIWGPRRWGGGPGWGGPGGYGPHGYWKYGPGPQDAFDQWHRQAHGEPTGSATDPVTGRPTGPTSPSTDK